LALGYLRKEEMNLDKIRAVHSFPIWLPQTQTWMYNQAKYLPGNVDVHVACEETRHLDQFAVPNIHNLKDISPLQYFWEMGLRKLRIRRKQNFLSSVISKTNADILHSHFGHIGWSNSRVAAYLSIRHIVTFYGTDVRMLPTRDQRWLYRYAELFDKADLFLCEGRHMAKELMGLGCRQEKIRIHHLGIDVETLPYRPRYLSDGEPLRVLIAANFREKKGIPYALEALAQLQRNMPVEITILGDAGPKLDSKREKRRILRTIERGRLKSRTRLLGYQPYSAFFDEAYKHHVFISPSVTASDGDTEGGAPVTLIEMIATGMPVISTIHCDIPEVVQYGMDDWLVNERDVTGLISKLEWLIDNKGNWNKFLTAGRGHVVEEFNAVRQGKRLAKIYEDTLGGCNEA